jgi:hypothetical protein
MRRYNSVPLRNRSAAFVDPEREKAASPGAFLRILDEWRESQDILPSRAEAIRRAVEIAAGMSNQPTPAKSPRRAAKSKRES